MPVKEVKTTHEQMVKIFEEISPFQVLANISNAVKPSLKELEIIENAMRQFKIPPGVINCIVHYVLLSTDMKFTKAYFERIVAHYSRLEMKTVPETEKN